MEEKQGIPVKSDRIEEGIKSLNEKLKNMRLYVAHTQLLSHLLSVIAYVE